MPMRRSFDDLRTVQQAPPPTIPSPSNQQPPGSPQMGSSFGTAIYGSTSSVSAADIVIKAPQRVGVSSTMREPRKSGNGNNLPQPAQQENYGVIPKDAFKPKENYGSISSVGEIISTNTSAMPPPGIARTPPMSTRRGPSAAVSPVTPGRPLSSLMNSPIPPPNPANLVTSTNDDYAEMITLPNGQVTANYATKLIRPPTRSGSGSSSVPPDYQSTLVRPQDANTPSSPSINQFLPPPPQRNASLQDEVDYDKIPDLPKRGGAGPASPLNQTQNRPALPTVPAPKKDPNAVSVAGGNYSAIPRMAANQTAAPAAASPPPSRPNDMSAVVPLPQRRGPPTGSSYAAIPTVTRVPGGSSMMTTSMATSPIVNPTIPRPQPAARAQPPGGATYQAIPKLQ